MVKNGPKEIQKLLNLGVPFEKNKSELELTKEGGHSTRRVAFVGDRTGHSIEKALINAVKKDPKIEVWENTFAIDLLVKNEKCYGLEVLKKNQTKQLFASTVILATGGLGQVYKHTTNPRISTGDGLAMAIRAGAKIQDLEFIQFHPTVLDSPRKKRFLLTEALRGEGAILINEKGKKFIDELKPRDIVARAIYKQKGKIYLDISHKNSKYIRIRFNYIYKELKKRGFNLTKDKIPVSPAAHYACGGVKVNLKGETSIKNLYAFGEVACTGVHGANRLASNSLLEAIVFSHRIAHEIHKTKINKYPKFKLREFSKLDTKYLKRKIKKIMWENAGISRNTQDLKNGLQKLQPLNNKFTRVQKNISSLEARNLLDIAIKIIESAIKRRNSLGCHYLEPDAPDTDD
jgi:L-aspartate oxidase